MVFLDPNCFEQLEKDLRKWKQGNALPDSFVGKLLGL
jgi:hypothetical protein